MVDLSFLFKDQSSRRKKPSGDFFEELGEYVYGFKDKETGSWKYVGKGSGDRCCAHLQEKGYSFDDCVIIARNLERFDKGKNNSSFLLESFMISQYNPIDNTISGKYKECFVMVDLSFLFNEYQSSQRNMFNELNDFYTHYKDVIGSNVGYTETRGSTWYIETGAKENKYFGIKVQTKVPEITVIFKMNNSSTSEYKKFVAQMKENLGGMYNLDTSTKDKISFPVKTLDEAVELWKSFVG